MYKTLFKTILIVLLFAFTQNATGQIQYPFMDTNLTFEQRIDDLIARLTLEEKVAQMMHEAPAIERLGIPAYNWWNECLHGVGRSGDKVTVFPQAIALAATFNVKAMEMMGNITSTEARAIYHETLRRGEAGKQYKGLTFWTPNINIFRDPRWGRGQETYGEDPYLTSQIGQAMVRGLQGNDPKYLKASACAKHYAVHSGPEHGRHAFDASADSYDLWDTYLPAFQDLVIDAKVSSVMCAYNRYEGAPCCANDLLMNKILREYWRFDGYVTTDCGAVYDFYKFHKTHDNATVASVDAALHGTDLECGSDYRKLAGAVKQGLISERQINVLLRRLLMIRFRLGMFDPDSKVPYADVPYNVLESETHQEHALKMARQSMVLLKNANHVLPLSKNIKRVALIGPNADNDEVQLGNYNGFPSNIITLRKALEARLGKNAVTYERGINYTTLDGKNTLKSIAAKAKNADVIIFAGGISPRLEGEEGDAGNEILEGFLGGDRTDIALPKIQTELMKELKATGKPVIFISMSGSAIAMPWEANNIDAILQAWYGGQSAGTAITDILWGDYNPSGRLPVTFYKSTDDLPDFNDYSMTNRTYRYFTGEPLFPFGYGLSYTTFAYSAVNTPEQAETGKNITITVDVANTGKYSGDEVVQLYVTHQTSEKHPIRALQGFQRVFLKPGEIKQVTFELTPQNLALVDSFGNTIQNSGIVDVYIGGTQPAAQALRDKTCVKTSITFTGNPFQIIK